MTPRPLAVAFEGKERVRVSPREGERTAGELHSRLPEPDMDQALCLLQRLNRWTLEDGTRVSRAVRVDGFEPWWFAQEHLLWRVLSPATRYRAALEHWLADRPLELRDPPDDLRSLVRSLERKGEPFAPRILRSPGTGTATRQRHRRRARRAASRRLAVHSLRSLTGFAARRPPALLSTVDRVTPGLGCDFRLHPIYRELERRGESFAEYVHVGQSAETAGDIAARGRPAVYFELLDRLGAPPASPRPGAPSLGDGSFEDLLLARVAARGLELAVAGARRYRMLKRVLRLHRPRYALVMDDSRHTHALVAACKELGIPVVGYQHAVGFNRFYAGLACYGWSGARSHAPDRYALWSDYFRERLLGFSELFGPADTFVCGNLRPPAVSSPPLRAGTGSERRIRVLLVSEPKANPDELLPVVARLVADDRFDVRLKIRPGEDIEAARGLFGKLFEGMRVVDTPSVHEAFADCDVVMGLYSSVLYEALQAPRPVVVVRSRSPYAGGLGAEGLATLVDDLESACDRVARAATLPFDELARRREVVWGSAPGAGVSGIFAAVDRELAGAAVA